MERKIWLQAITRSQKQITTTFGIDSLTFHVSYWYSDVDFFALEDKYGQHYMDKLYFHIAAFEINKLVSLQAEKIDWGAYAPHHTVQFETFWQKIVHKVWAQWRYENNLPHYKGPTFSSQPSESRIKPIENRLGSVEILAFCGGGKDSLVSMKLLERAEIPHSSFVYSNSVYGTAQQQHDLNEGLLEHGVQFKRHAQWIYDSFVDSPVTKLYPEYNIESIVAAETPASIFGVLPIVLQHGYRYIALAHERSANVGNLIWDATGEDVNHQWGKSFEAECLINDYLHSEFVANVSYFSLLQPIYDVLIFNLLRSDLGAISQTHSCNLKKPWCCRCPKCAYVWLNYMAYLPTDLIDSIFNVNLFDLEENQLWYYQMLGLGTHTPFECIGQVAETRLAFELCRRKGLSGKAMDMYAENFPQLDIGSISNNYLDIDISQSGIPPAIVQGILPQLQKAAGEARHYIQEVVAGSKSGDCHLAS